MQPIRLVYGKLQNMKLSVKSGHATVHVLFVWVSETKSRACFMNLFHRLVAEALQGTDKTAGVDCTACPPPPDGRKLMPWSEEHRKAVCGKTACTVWWGETGDADDLFDA